MRNAHFFLTTLKDKICGNVIKFVMLNILTKFGSKMYRQLRVFQWLVSVLLLLQICFCFVMRDASCCLFLIIIKLMAVKHLDVSRYLDVLLNIDNPYFDRW